VKVLNRLSSLPHQVQFDKLELTLWIKPADGTDTEVPKHLR